MSPEKTKELHDKYPKILMRDGKSILRGGNFECDDGWFEVIDKYLFTFNNLLEDLQKIYPEAKVDSDFIIIKSKFASLRIQGFSISNIPDFYNYIFYSIAARAEWESESVCETCGEFGQYRGDLFWVETLCDKHHEEKQKKDGTRGKIMPRLR